jgi:hypothetical protein
VAQLNDLVESVRGLGAGKPAAEAPSVPWEQLLAGLDNLGKLRPQVEVVAPAQPGTQKLLENLADSLENSFLPLIKAMDKKIDIDLRTHNRMLEISTQLRDLGTLLGHEQRSDAADDEAP